MPEITRKVRPPRALAVPWPLGFPLGEPDNPRLQRDVLLRLLDLLARLDVPVLEHY